MVAERKRKLAVKPDVAAAIDYIVRWLLTDGGHHKQYYLEQAARVLGVDAFVLERLGHEPGIPS